jgi:YidC/Oxa1 family membrane protein insertase
MKRFQLFCRAWRDMRRFQKLKSRNELIVFYSEGADYWKFFESIIEELTNTLEQPIIWLTSDPNDPLLKDNRSGIRAFFIGEGIFRTVVLNTLNVNLVIMTMPDLGNSYIKRSGSCVHYMYLFHSIVSTHMIYRKGAFDHFDSILCVGKHHVEEIREWEVLNQLPSKQLFNHGYGVLDKLLEEKKQRPLPLKDEAVHVLIAPSWGPNGLLETRGEETIEVLLDAGLQVTVRPHQMTSKRSPNLKKKLIIRFGNHPSFNFEGDTRTNESLHAANILVSDWSGVALEFAFGLEKPVVFIDQPLKLNNAEYSRLKSVPLEILLREKIGRILPAEDIKKLPSVVAELAASPEDFEMRVKELRENFVFNIGNSGARGAEVIKEVFEANWSRLFS